MFSVKIADGQTFQKRSELTQEHWVLSRNIYGLQSSEHELKGLESSALMLVLLIYDRLAAPQNESANEWIAVL